MRRSKARIRRNFAENKKGGEDYAFLVEAAIEYLEHDIQYNDYENGRTGAYERLDPEEKMLKLCDMLQ